MKNNKIYLGVIFAFFLIFLSCEQEKDVLPNDDVTEDLMSGPPYTDDDTLMPRLDPKDIDHNSLEEYPAIVLHTIWREFYFCDSTGVFPAGYSTNWKPFLEERLIDLYPTQAYTGCVSDYDDTYNEFKDSFYVNIGNFLLWQDYWGYTRIDTVDSAHNFTTKWAEFKLMDFTSEERSEWNYIDSSAISNVIHTGTEMQNIISLYGGDLWHKKRKVVSTLMIAAAIMGGGYIAYRAYRARKVAIEEATDRYNSTSDNHNIYRHILASCALRKWCGFFTSYMIGSMKEHLDYFTGSNNEGETFQDRKNNYVGVLFRYGIVGDGWRRAQWADNTETFISNTNNALNTGWRNNNPTYWQAWRTTHT